MKSRRKYSHVRHDFDELNQDEKLRFVIDVITDTARTFAEKDFSKVQSALDRTAQTVFGMASRMAESLNKAASKTYEAEWEEVKSRRKSPRKKPSARRTKTS